MTDSNGNLFGRRYTVKTIQLFKLVPHFWLGWLGCFGMSLRVRILRKIQRAFPRTMIWKSCVKRESAQIPCICHATVVRIPRATFALEVRTHILRVSHASDEGCYLWWHPYIHYDMNGHHLSGPTFVPDSWVPPFPIF
jgi:hypothetical protein